MKTSDDLVLGVRTLRPFVPARDFRTSLRFYEALGFAAKPLDDGLAELRLGAHAFLLQNFYVASWAENSMMHVLVEDLASWWTHIDALDLATTFGVEPPRAPRTEPWGLRVAYVFDPSGVLWHFAEDPAGLPSSEPTRVR